MIGLVVVSHSAALATAACEFAMLMAPEQRPRVEIAAGSTQGGFGTSARKIVEAIKRAASDDGVLVLVDLGSAVLNAETALHLLGPTDFEVRISEASFVEGLTAAIATAAVGAVLDEVDVEACRAGASKHQSTKSAASDRATWQSSDVAAATTATARVAREHGLHARPSARVVKAVTGLDAQVRIRNASTASRFVDASSITDLMTLGATAGDVVFIQACGSEARLAVDRVVALISDSSTPANQRTVDGPLIGVSPGVAVGVARRWNPVRREWSEAPYDSSDVAGELERLAAARDVVRSALDDIRSRIAKVVGEGEAMILDTWRGVLDDRGLLDPIERRIAEGETALHSWVDCVSTLIARIDSLADPYQRQRASDIADIRDRVASELAQLPRAPARQEAPAVLVAAELSAADVAELDPSTCLGIITTRGSANSHASILARSLGVPAVVGASAAVVDALVDRVVLLDGTAGLILSDPSDEQVKTVRALYSQQARGVGEPGTDPAETSDGVKLAVVANIASLAQAGAAMEAGAEGIGLLRTEFLFAKHLVSPTIDEHYSAYAEIAECLQGRPLTIRTFDGASDKPLRFLGGGLTCGQRGLALSLAYPEVLIDQLRAVVRIARRWPTRLLFPFVVRAVDVREARDVLNDALVAERISPHDFHGLEIGAMIECPDAVLEVASIAAEVDFLSIGTNDLTAALSGPDRSQSGHESAVVDPSVLRLVRQIVAERADMSISVCGELASELTAVPLLIGLGVRQLSVSSTSVVAVKREIRRWSHRAAIQLAGEALELRNAAEIDDLVRAVRAGESSLSTRAAGNEETGEKTHQ